MSFRTESATECLTLLQILHRYFTNHNKYNAMTLIQLFKLFLCVRSISSPPFDQVITFTKWFYHVPHHRKVGRVRHSIWSSCVPESCPNAVTDRSWLVQSGV